MLVSQGSNICNNQKMSGQRIDSLTSIKGLMALFVFTFHFFGKPVLPNMGEIAVTSFFALSGFTLSMSYSDRLLTGKFDWRDYLIRRASKIYPIQWLTLLICIVFGVDDSHCLWPIPLHFTLLQDYVPLWQSYYSYNVISWFLSAILFSYVTFPFVFSFSSSRKRLATGLYVILIVAFVAFLKLLPGTIGTQWLANYNPFLRSLDFYLGVFVYFIWKQKADVIAKINKTACCGLEILIIASLIACSVAAPWFKGVPRTPAYWYPLITVMILLFASEDKGVVSKVFNNKIVLTLSSLSLSFYMFHTIVFRLFPFSSMPVALRYLSWLLITIVAAYFCEKYFIPRSAETFKKLVYKWTSKK